MYFYVSSFVLFVFKKMLMNLESHQTVFLAINVAGLPPKFL